MGDGVVGVSARRDSKTETANEYWVLVLLYMRRVFPGFESKKPFICLLRWKDERGRVVGGENAVGVSKGRLG